MTMGQGGIYGNPQQVQFPLFAGGRGMGMGPFATMYTRDPRQGLAYNLMAQGTSTAPIQHWAQGLGRLAQALAGGFIDSRVRGEYEDRNKAMTSTMMDALRQMQGTPAETKSYGDGTTIDWNEVKPDRNKALQTLAGNPDTAPMAFQMLGIGQQPETFGSPVKAVGKDGKTVYLQIGNRGTTRQLEGYVPPEDKTSLPSTVQEWEYFSRLDPAQREAFLTMKRGNRPVDIGGSVVVPSMTQPGAVAGQIPKTLPPEQTPETKGAQTTATETARADVEKQTMRPKAAAALADLERKAKLVTDTVDKALTLAQNSMTATGYGNMLLSGLPNTDARSLNNYLDTIKANIGFDRLQQMRENSPTGGALGAVSEMENRLLQAVQGALDPLQKDQLVQNLGIIKQLYPRVLAERRAAFNRDYGDARAQQPGTPPDPAQSKPRLRYNPETGELE